MNNIGYIDKTVSTMTGCAPDFPCYQRCWARNFANRLSHNPKLSQEARAKYKGFHPAYWPERLPQLARGNGEWIAVNFMGDMFTVVDRIGASPTLRTCALAPWNTFLFLTKRPNNMKETFLWNNFDREGFQHCFFGTSISTQSDADSRIPELLKLEGLRLWLSVEPMLEPITLRPSCLKKLAWVVCGPGNWKNAPWEDAWWKDLRQQCDRFSVLFWLKGKHIDPCWQRKPPRNLTDSLHLTGISSFPFSPPSHLPLPSRG